MEKENKVVTEKSNRDYARDRIEIFVYTENKYKGTQYIYSCNNSNIIKQIDGTNNAFIAVADKLYYNFDNFINEVSNKEDFKREISLLTTKHYETALTKIKNISEAELYNLHYQKNWIDENIINHVVNHKKQPNTLYNYYYQDTNRIYNIFVYNDIYARTLRKIDNSRKLNNLLDIGINFNEDDLYSARKNKKEVRLKYFKDIDRLATKTINNKLYLNLCL